MKLFFSLIFLLCFSFTAQSRFTPWGSASEDVKKLCNTKYSENNFDANSASSEFLAEVALCYELKFEGEKTVHFYKMAIKKAPNNVGMYESLISVLNRNKELMELNYLQVAESLGSEYACISHAIYIGKKLGKKKYEQCLFSYTSESKYEEKYRVFQPELHPKTERCKVISRLLERNLLTEYDELFIYSRGVCVLANKDKASRAALLLVDKFESDIISSGTSNPILENRLHFNQAKVLSHANYLVGMSYYNGGMVLPDCDKAIYYLKNASDINNHEGFHKLYPTYKTEYSDFDKGLAQNAIGKIFIEKKCGENDNDADDALEWYVKSARNNNPEAQFILGEYYIATGDIKLAKKWLQKAYRNGFKKAKSIWDRENLSTK